MEAQTRETTHPVSTTGHRIPRWVLDTHGALSTLIRPDGITGRLRLAWQARLSVPLVSRDQASELIRVLAYPKFRLSGDEQHDPLADYLAWTETERIANPSPKAPLCRSAHDVPFLQLALASKADALVTVDADPLAVSQMRKLAIITPAAAITRLPP